MFIFCLHYVTIYTITKHKQKQLTKELKMKTKIELENKYKVTPTTVKGMDGKEYEVFTFFSYGRGWKQTERHAVLKEQNVVIEVQIVMFYSEGRHKIARGMILNIDALNVDLFDFAKKPYVRKDGTFTVCRRSVYKTLRKAYGIDQHNYTVDLVINENNFIAI